MRKKKTGAERVAAITQRKIDAGLTRINISKWVKASDASKARFDIDEAADKYEQKAAAAYDQYMKR